MPTKRSRCLVIDASVARAAGSKGTESSTAVRCRDFLDEAMHICHRGVMTPEIYREWKRHWSRFSRKWLHRMMGARKVERLQSLDVGALHTTLCRVEATRSQIVSMKKDLHLVAAALATDNCVISLDEEARVLFRRAADTIQDLRKVVWVNPENVEGEKPIQWLRAGAPWDSERRLGKPRSRT